METKKTLEGLSPYCMRILCDLFSTEPVLEDGHAAYRLDRSQQHRRAGIFMMMCGLLERRTACLAPDILIQRTGTGLMAKLTARGHASLMEAAPVAGIVLNRALWPIIPFE